MNTLPRRQPLAQLPTPLQRLERLSSTWGGPTIWVKRDDLAGFELSGNKVRKLEYLLAAAIDAGADTIITCGAIQSNHCRATALACAALGLDVVLVLRSVDGRAPEQTEGNYLLDLLAGADIRYIDPAIYADRQRYMGDLADTLAGQGRQPWIVPEGGSDFLGMWGFVTGMAELDQQLAALPRPAGIWHAASSGGTTAGLGWAVDRLGLDVPVIGCSVGETVPELEERIEGIWTAALEVHGGRWPTPPMELIDDHVGLGYGQATREELEIQAEATALTGMVFDPTYTGKALVGLRREIEAGRFQPEDDVVFWHTGGGFAAFAHDWSDVLAGD